MRFEALIVALILLHFGPLLRAEQADLKVEATQQSCLSQECHSALHEQKFIHAPVIQEDCSLCHVPPDQAPHRNLEEGKTHQLVTLPATYELCGQCHKGDQFSSQFVHEPFEKACTTCHDPHGGSARYFLPSKKAGESCAECHPDLAENVEYVHAPVALEMCLDCHNPHTSSQEALLSRDSQSLCYYCHFSFKRELDASVSHHSPLDKNCFECHAPHGSDHPYFLPEEGEELCRLCHEDVFTRMQDTNFTHQQMIRNRKCSDCHNPHFSDHNRLLKISSKDVCLACHNREIEASENRTIPSIEEQIENSEFVHGPIRQGDCTPCHEAHGSNDPRLIEHGFPAGFYAEYREGAYALCFQCHSDALIEDEFTNMTGFRDGRRNLHYVHVQKEKGRSCRACHHEHASNMPFHLRDWVQFGKWEMRFKFRKRGDGGYCQEGCHRAQEYSRSKLMEEAEQ